MATYKKRRGVIPLKDKIMYLDRVDIKEPYEAICNFGHHHESSRTTQRIEVCRGKGEEDYSLEELDVIGQWMTDLLHSKFIGPSSQISNNVLKNILNATIKKYCISPK